jgi:uncharacterized protein (DUF1778 family)
MAPAAGLASEGTAMTTGQSSTGQQAAAGRKDRVLHVRFTASECKAVDAAATAAGLTVSGFMRSLSLEGAGVRPFLTEEDRLVFAALASDMHAVGVNLNQLARAANASGRIVPSALDPVLAEIQTLVAALAIELRDLGRRGAQGREGA